MVIRIMLNPKSVDMESVTTLAQAQAANEQLKQGIEERNKQTIAAWEARTGLKYDPEWREHIVRPDGPFREVDGSIVREGTLRNGEWDGEVREYNGDRLTRSVVYKNGVQTGSSKEYRFDGTLAVERVPGEDGQSVTEIHYDTSGKTEDYRLVRGKRGVVLFDSRKAPKGKQEQKAEAKAEEAKPKATQDPEPEERDESPDSSDEKESRERVIRTFRSVLKDRDNLKEFHKRIREFSNKWRGFVDKLFALSEAYKKTGNETNDRYGSNITAEERWDGSSIYQSYYAENAYEHATAFMLNTFGEDAYGRRRSDDEILEDALRAVDEFPIMPITKKPENPGEVDLRHGGAMLDIRSDADKFIASTSPHENRWGQWAVPRSLFMDESGNVVASNSETAKRNMKDYLRFAWALRKFKEEERNFYSSVPHSETRIPSTFPSFTDYKILYTVTNLDERKNIEALISKRNPWIMALLDKYGVAPVVEDRAWARVLDLATQEDVDALEAAIDSAVAQTQTPVQQSGTVAQANERGFDPATYDWSKGERNGRDVTARDIRDVFGIKANIQNPKLTNSIFDAYATLAKAMNVPYEALSLGGLLPPISLNSRLKTKAGRYYRDGSGIEFNGAITPDEVGATAIHEWVHAMEYALYRGKDSPKIASREVGIRDELREALRGMTDAIEGSSWGKIMKKSKSRDWSSTSEMLARAIESYMETKGVHNPHREGWAKLARLEGSPRKRLLEENRYPNAEQTAEFAPAMERFFQTLRVGTNASSGKTTLFKLGKEAFPEAPRSTLKDRVEIRGAMAVPFAGSKASILEDYPELFRGIGNAAKEAGGRIIDAFAGAGAYTAGLGALDALPRGSVLNEWAVSRYVMHKMLAENPEAMARAAEDIATRFVNSPEMAEVRRRVEQANKDGKHVVNINQPVIDWFYDELNGKHGTIYVDGTDNTEFGDAALRETPESAALYQVLQSIVSSGYPVNFVWKKGELKIDVSGGNFRAGQVGRIAEKNAKTNKWRMSKPGEGVFNVKRYPQRILNTGRIYQQNGVQVTRGDGWALAKTARRGDVILVDPAYLGTQSYGGKKNVDANDANNKDVAIDKLVDLVKWADANGVSVVYTNELSDKSGMGGMSRADYEAVWREALDRIGSDGVAVNFFNRKVHGMRGSQAPRADIVFATGRVARLFNVSNAELDAIKARNGFETDEEAEDRAYLDAVERGDTEAARRMVEERARKMGVENPIPEQTDAYKVRVSAPPKKTIKVYKVFTIDQAGRPTALFVSGMDALPMGVWLDAQDTWHFTAKNGKQYVPSTANPNGRGGKTGAAVEIPDEATRQELIKRGFLPQGSNAKTVVALAYRPGWHAGDMPFFPQGGVKRAGSNYGNVHHARQVVFECEMDADHDYTEEARNQPKARTKDGRVNEANADLQSMPDGGFYRYSTNPLTKGGKRGTWFISGSLKINRALTQEEADRILQENGFAPQEWEQGELDLAQLGYRGDESEAARKTLAPVTYDDNGNVIPLSQRFNPDNPDIRLSVGGRLGRGPVAEPGGDVREAGEGALAWLRRKFVHSQTPVFDAVRRVMGVGREPPDALNVEAAAKNVHGKIRARQEMLQRAYLEPLKAILAQPGMDRKRFDDYALALHALERNRMIQERSVVVDPTTGEVVDFGVEAGSGVTNAWAERVIREIQRDPFAAQYKEAANILAEMNRFVLRGAVADGLLTEAQARTWMRLSPHYVPLKSGGAAPGAIHKRATGRFTRPDSVLVNSMRQAYATVRNGELNRVNKTMADWIREYDPNGEQVGGTVPESHKHAKIKMADPQYVPKGSTAEALLRERGIRLVETEDKGGYWVDTGVLPNALKRVVRESVPQGDDIVTFWENGERKFIRFEGKRGRDGTAENEAARIADALNFKNVLHKEGRFWDAIRGLTRWKANVSTSWNPTFIVRNMGADVFNTANLMMIEGKYAELARTMRNYPEALRTIARLHSLRREAGDSKMGMSLSRCFWVIFYWRLCADCAPLTYLLFLLFAIIALSSRRNCRA